VNILLVRLDGIGDALACVPLVAALRDAGHRLGVALTTRNAAIFARATFAWTHVLQRRPWPAHGHAAEDVERTVEEAGRIGYDVALVASEEPDAYALAARCAPARVGFINGWEKPLKSLLVRRRLTRAIVRAASPGRAAQHEVVTMFALGGGLHGETEPTRDLRRLRPLVVDESAPPAPAQTVIALQLGPKWAALGLGASRVAEYVRALRALAPVRLLASGDEAAQLRSLGPLLETHAAADASVFEGTEGMRAWKRAIADAAVLVTPDSGAAHVAGMTGTPCVDLFPPGKFVRCDMSRWKPWAAESALLVADRDAPLVAAARELFERRCARC
jgi:ADP-heptose:LPS heptosyltransferase